jgi:hypothetical protein
MANTLTQVGIETGNLVEAYHITQSIDAFTGAEAYDITLSGSLTITGSVFIDGLTTASQSNILTYDSSSGQLYYTASSAIGGGGSTFTYEIGQYVSTQGGVIFHRYKDGTIENYLVVDTTDLSTSSAWSNVTGTLIGATAQSTWDGLSNSNAIVGQSGSTAGAAKLCLDSTNNSKSDWYLPSIDELSLIRQNRFNINKTLSGNSAFGSISGATQIFYNAYWSSTESGGSSAWYFLFSNGNTSSFGSKNDPNYVRAVRKFSI